MSWRSVKLYAVGSFSAISRSRRQSGQTCICANRVFVQDGVYDKFSKALAEKVSAFKVGEGITDGVTHGPLIHQNQVDKVQSHVEDATKHGAKVLLGGKKMDSPGFFFEPTILTEVQRCAIDEEETFGGSAVTSLDKYGSADPHRAQGPLALCIGSRRRRKLLLEPTSQPLALPGKEADALLQFVEFTHIYSHGF